MQPVAPGDNGEEGFCSFCRYDTFLIGSSVHGGAAAFPSASVRRAPPLHDAGGGGWRRAGSSGCWCVVISIVGAIVGTGDADARAR